MKFTARRTAAMICAGAIALSMTALPVAAAATTPDNYVSTSRTGATPPPPSISPFAGHGAVG